MAGGVNPPGLSSTPLNSAEFGSVQLCAISSPSKGLLVCAEPGVEQCQVQRANVGHAEGWLSSHSLLGCQVGRAGPGKRLSNGTTGPGRALAAV